MSQSQQPLYPMVQVYELLAAMVKSTLSHPTHQPNEKVIQDTLVKAITSTRTFLVSTPDDLRATWDVVRNSIPTTDYLLDLTAQLHMALADSPLTFEQVTERMGKAYSAHRTASKLTAIDPDLHLRLPEKSVIELLNSNLWFVTLALISHRPNLAVWQRPAP